LADETVTTEAPVTQGPALNATSDAPVVEKPADPPPVNTEINTIAAKADETPATEAETEVEDEAGEVTETETGQVNDTAKDAGGEKPKDEIPAYAKREITKARNRQREERAAREAAEAKATETAAQLAAALETLKNVSSSKTAADTAAAIPRPQREKFDSPDAYDNALIEWAAENAAKTAEAKIQAREAERQQKLTKDQQEQATKKAADDLAKAWRVKVEKFSKDHPDFMDVVIDNDDLKISQAVSTFLAEADDGPEIAYHMGKNPEIAERISQLSPAKAGIELGKLSASLEAAKKPKVSRAPRPVTPVRSANSAGTKSLEDMSMDEYAAQRMPVLQKERLGPTARARAN